MAPSLVSNAESIARNVNLQCPVCNEWFETYPKKDAHQRSVGHFQCSVCKLKSHDSGSVVHHILREHKTEHDIRCPGCPKVFQRPGAWMAHIEAYECASIFPETLEARQKKRQGFIDALARLQEPPQALTGTFKAPYQSDTWKDDPILDTLDGHDNLKPHHGETADQNYTKPEDFPRLATQEYRVGGSKQLDLLTGDAPVPKPLQTNNAWAQKKNLFPKAQCSSSPKQAAWGLIPQPSVTTSGTANGQESSQSQDRNAKIQVAKANTIFPARVDPWAGLQKASSSSEERILDPDHHNFNAGVFYESILGQFKCPHSSCNKKYKTVQSLTAHLKSLAHRGEKITCPSCRHSFTSKTAMVQHMESAVTKCSIRESDQFRELLARMTGGVLDAEPEGPLEDRANPETMVRDMPRVFVDDKAFADLRITPSARPVPGAEPREGRAQEQKGAGENRTLPRKEQEKRQKRFW